ncbi:MAG: alpha-mannosidase, partial [Clostridiales bacterium]|nr:alpha-mannosidase [Clostridiales bacterium]
EGDLNMAQGEAVVRHVLYSRRFLADRFQKQPSIMWCPDTFGHPANLPQLLAKSGIRHYFHTRCGLGVGSRADCGFRFLEDSMQPPVYWWRGLDGSRALVVNAVYNRALDSRGVLRASARMEDFDCERAMLTYGVGDHGGGPTERDIRWVMAARDYPTMPDLYFSTADEFCSAIEAGDYPLPERRGEMNFVFDGCYTTHADVKRQNRLCEMGLTAAEKLCAIAADAGLAYPAEEFEKLWRKALFNQFHDILDGSGVPDTYTFTSEQADLVLAGLKQITGRAMGALAGRYGIAGQRACLLYNPSGYDRAEDVLLETDAAGAADETGAPLASQAAEGGLKVRVELPASGLRVVALTQAAAPGERHVTDRGDHFVVDTPIYEVEIAKRNGQITSLYDRDQDWYVVRREEIGWRLKNGVLNALQIHMEEPTPMSGWTIGDVRTVHTLLSGARAEVVADGPVESRLRFTHTFGDSTIVQDIVIGAHRRDIRFETEVDWREWGDFDRDAPMLRALFTPAIQNKDAVYEIPFGTITRPADDREYPALTWADISDGAHGFAVLNDCKHGYRCRGNAMELALIRSGWLPDPKSDVGGHRFTYAILPHAGDWQAGGVPAAAQALNLPVAVAPARGAQAGPFSLARCEGAALAAVKRAESGQGWVYRLYNPGGERAAARFAPGRAFGSIERVDLMEAPSGAAPAIEGGVAAIDLAPYEVVSLLVR